MTDVASLSFQIDSSQAQTASQNLDGLAGSADKVRASTRFLVTSFGDANSALTQLATSGRASLASFEQISQNLDTITSRMQALRAAAADTIGTFSNQGITSALTSFQQQFDAMSQLFGSSSAQLEKFNQQAQYLGMNSYQVSSALQRITEAQQNLTPAGQALRQSLGREGISTSGDAAQILQQIVQYSASHQQSQQAYQTFQGFVGPTDPQTYARLMNQPYHTLQSRTDFNNSQIFDTRAAQIQDDTAKTAFENQNRQAQYNDVSRNFTFGNGGYLERDQLTKYMQNDLSKEKVGTKAYKDDLSNLSAFQKAGYNSEDYVNAAGEFLGDHPGELGLNLRYRTFAGLGEYLDEPNKNGMPSWYARFSNRNLNNAYKSQISEDYQAKQAALSPFDVYGNFKLNTSTITDYYKNDLGLYKDPHAAGDSKPVGANEQFYLDQNSATTAQQLGYGGFVDILNAQTNLGNLKDTGPNSYMDQINQRLGTTEALALKNQQLSNQQYIVDNAATPGFDQLQQLRGQGFLASQATGQNSTEMLVQYAKSIGLDPGRFMNGGPGGRQLTPDEIVNGVAGGDAGAMLTGGQRTAFGNILQAYRSNDLTQQNTSFAQQQTLSQGTLNVAQNTTGQGDYQAQLSALQAYDAEMIKSGDAMLANTASMHAYTLEIQNQAAVAARATALLREQNDIKSPVTNALSAALTGDNTGAYAQAEYQYGIQQQVAQYDAQNNVKPGSDAENKQRIELGRQAQLSMVDSVQGGTLSAQNAALGAQASLSSLGQGSDARNRAETLAQYQDQLINSTGDYHAQIQALIESTVKYKDTLDSTNLALSVMQGIAQSFERGNIEQAVAAAAPGDKGRVRAEAEAAAQYANQQNTSGNLTPQQQQYQQTAGNAAEGKFGPRSTSVGNDGVNPHTYQIKAALFGASNPDAMYTPAQNAVVSHLMSIMPPASQLNGVSPSLLAMQGLFESTGNPNAGASNPEGPVGIGQFIPTTANSLGLSDRTNAHQSLIAMSAFDSQIAKKYNLNLNNPRDRQILASQYGTIRKQDVGYSLSGGGTGAALTGNAGVEMAVSAAGQSQDTIDAAQGSQIIQNLDAKRTQNQAVLPLLARGDTAQAAYVRASFTGPETDTAKVPAVILQQQTQVLDSLATEIATLNANNKNSLSNNQTLAVAEAQGPNAVIRAQAGITAQESARTSYVGNDKAGFIADQTAQNYALAQAGVQKDFGARLSEQSISNSLEVAKLNNQFITNPVARSVADTVAAAQNQIKASGLDTSTPQGAAAAQSYIAAATQGAQLQGVAMNQARAAGNADQIGNATSQTLQDLAFSYQQGPGAGLYARKELSGLFNTGARSLFNQAIGQPTSDFVSGNISNAINYLTGNTGDSQSANSNSGLGPGGGSSASSNTLGGISGYLQSKGSNMLLTDALSGIGSYLGIGSSVADSALGSAAGGAIATLPATAAASTAPSFLSGIGSFLASFLATGGAFDAGVRMPFATGGVFGPGVRHPFAAGDVFNTPTTMPMAMLGEAGPEAIMPLRRGADGRLGIATGGGGGGGGPSIVVNAPITVGQNALGSGGKMDQRQTMDLQRQLHATITSAVKGVIADQSRPGGMVQQQG